MRRPIPALLLSFLALTAVTAPAAQAAGPQVNNGTPIYWCTSAKPVCTQAITTIQAPPKRIYRAKLICWEDNRTQAPYTYGRWFYVNVNRTVGYVNAESVRNQVSTPPCGNFPALRATNWALDRVGQEVYADLCLGFVYDAYVQTGGKIGGPTGPDVSAWDWYNSSKRLPSRRHADDPWPPRGSLAFWKPDAYNAYGHVAISLGNGMTVSTSERTTTAVHLMSIADRNQSKPYAGYYKQP
ncbi:MAG: CHAP domain-containing protein [Patulibacter minatonensis]